jgi:hypothetical protein
MKIIAFEPEYNEKHCDVLRALVAGIPGAEVRTLGEYEPCDIAIIFGAAKDAYPPTWPKREILKKHQGRRLLMVESAFVKRGEYFQVGWNGFAGNADFRNDDMPMDRWEAMGVKTLPWQRRNGPVVVCGQLPRDTQVQHVDHVGWCRSTVAELRRSGHDVRFRPDPRQNNWSVYHIDRRLIDTRSMDETLADAKCLVTWNSTSAVDALIQGVPVIACHPSSVSYPVATHSIADINHLRYPSRRNWLAGLGYAQWTLDEMRAGLPWMHLNR